MKVILLKDIKGTGKAGDVIEASAGYAKNFLFKKKLAKEATASNMNELKLQNKAADKRAAEELAKAKETAETLKKETVVIEVKAGDNGKIFGSVTNKEIAEFIKSHTGIEVDKRKVSLKDAIKATGTYTVKVKLHHEVTAEVKVEVKGN